MRANLLVMFMIFATAANVMRIYLNLPDITVLTKATVGLSFGIIAIDMIGSFAAFLYQQLEERRSSKNASRRQGGCSKR